jgi:hypothetical protein
LNLEQAFSKGQLLKIQGKAVTVSLYLSDGELVSGTSTWPDIPAESWTYEYVAASSRVLLIAGTSYMQEASLIIQPRIAEGINIKAIKLELGSEQTLAHQENGQWVLNEIPDYGQELAKCQRYLIKYPFAGDFTTDNTGRLSAIFCLPVTLAANPSSITFSDFICYDGAWKNPTINTIRQSSTMMFGFVAQGTDESILNASTAVYCQGTALISAEIN